MASIKPDLIFKLGDSPSELGLSTHLSGNDVTVRLINQSSYLFSQIKLTLSYFDAEDQYLDFEDLSPEPVAAMDTRADIFEIEPPMSARVCILDATAQKQTLLKRHWKLISTATLILWAGIMLARRWPSF